MFENLLKLVLRPGSERGWGCAAGGAPERDLRLGGTRPSRSRADSLRFFFDTDGCGAGALARWFCGQWSARNAVGAGPLSHVVSRHDIAGIWVAFFRRCQRYRCGQVVGVVGASGTHSPRAANRSLDDGFGGVFYSAVAEPKEFSFQCDDH